MEVDAKVKELEDEVKVLKAEIRNVLLDIRDAVLEKTNPLSEQEPAFMRLDLNTTARTLAADEAARAAREALDQARAEQAAEPPAEEPEAAGPDESPPEEEEATEPPTDEEEPEAAAEEATDEAAEEPEAPGDGGVPPAGEAFDRDKAPLEGPLGHIPVPPMYLAYLPPTGATTGLAEWVTNAMATLGPHDFARVITIHRLWGCLPPNISYALAHLQRLVRSSQQPDPPWLKAMQDLEKLASC